MDGLMAEVAQLMRCDPSQPTMSDIALHKEEMLPQISDDNALTLCAMHVKFACVTGVEFRAQRIGGCEVRLEGIAMLEAAAALASVSYSSFDSLPVLRSAVSHDQSHTDVTQQCNNLFGGFQYTMLASIAFRVHARGKCSMIDGVDASTDVRLCQSYTKFRRRQLISSRPDQLQPSARRTPAKRITYITPIGDQGCSLSFAPHKRLCLPDWTEGPSTVLGATTSSTDDH
jgi:hypothetical protein